MVKPVIAWLCCSMPPCEIPPARPTPPQHATPPQPSPEAFDLAARAVVQPRIYEAAHGSAKAMRPLHSLLWDTTSGGLWVACWDTAQSSLFGF